MYGQCPDISRAEAPHNSFRERFQQSCLSRKKRSEQAIIYPFQYRLKNLPARKRPSALSALSDGLLISAGDHFKKDRQKDRQLIQLSATQEYLAVGTPFAVQAVTRSDGRTDDVLPAIPNPI
jgi:hypothetical protein